MAQELHDLGENMLRVLFHCVSLASFTALACTAGCEHAKDAFERLPIDAGDASRSDADMLDAGDARAADADGACGTQPSYWCVSSCGTDSLERPRCGDAGWTCAAGTVPHTSCPPGSCFSLPFVCCRPDGSLAPHICDTQLATYACSDGAALTYVTTSPNPCSPDAGLDAASD